MCRTYVKDFDCIPIIPVYKHIHVLVIFLLITVGPKNSSDNYIVLETLLYYTTVNTVGIVIYLV